MDDREKRVKLDDQLRAIVGAGHVYFQPPSNIRMQYPAIVYSRNDIIEKKADNRSYLHNISYQVTLIDSDPESEFLPKLLEIPTCSYDRHFTSDGMYHDVFTINI